ncbi:MAG: formate dehydrogenase accessory sulfurtransferase FdhD [Chloroflexota bacterium]
MVTGDGLPDTGRAPERGTAVWRWEGDQSLADTDSVAAEEPLQVLVDGTPLTVAMRTPGHDLELVLGLLSAEGIIRSAADVASVRLSPSGQADLTRGNLPVELLPLAENVVDVCLRRPGAPAASGWQRHLLSSSACGLCGAATLEALEHDWPPVPVAEQVSAGTIYTFPAALRAAQTVFASTGGLHAAGLFTVDGELLCLREDVGRHNAVDKIVGSRLLGDGLPLPGHCLMLSGRAGFEILQKAAAAGVPIVCAVSAPSSLAVQTACRFGITLIGFLRGERMNIYSAPERITHGGGGHA